MCNPTILDDVGPICWPRLNGAYKLPLASAHVLSCHSLFWRILRRLGHPGSIKNFNFSNYMECLSITIGYFKR